MQNNAFDEALGYSGEVYRTAYYLTYSEIEAEDLVQEVYLKAYANWDKFEPGTNCRAWLFKILYNTHINRLKKEAKAPYVLPPEKLESFSVEINDSPADLKKIVEELVSDEIKAAIKKLPPEYIDTLILAWLGGFTYAEIAEILNCPMGTVMSRLSRARLLLRKSLEDYRKGE